jgi:hypothetical protein
MCEQVNINVSETNETINIVSSEIQEVIDINVFETTEDVTLNITEQLIQVNVNKVTSAAVTNTSELINDGEDGVHPFITAEDLPSLTGFVPYTGATEDVNLGEFGLLTGNIEFDNTPTNIPTTAGAMYWNDADGTADLILKGGNVKLQVGQESVIRVVNKTATNINLLEANYQAVRVTGAQGQRLKVDLAQATTDNLSAETIGLVTETINNNQEGFITTSGLVRNINTTGSLQGETWADGDVLYLSPTTAGNVTKVKPTAPNHLVIVGYVVHAHANQGSIFVKVDNGYELDELHNVKITSAANNNVLAYTSATDIWENKTVETALGYTPFELPSLTSGSVLFSNGTTIAQDNAQLFWNDTNNRLGIGTNAPTAQLDVKGNVVFGDTSTNQSSLVVSTPYSNTSAVNMLSLKALGKISIVFGPGNVQCSSIGGLNISNQYFESGLFFSTATGGVLNERMRIVQTGNVLINTTTDAGFKLDVNGTARVSGVVTGTSFTATSNGDSFKVGSFNVLDYGNGCRINYASGAQKVTIYSNASGGGMILHNSGNVSIGSTATEVTSAIFNVPSTTKGFLPPRMTTTEKNAIATPAVGLIIFDVTLNKLCVRGVSAWETITSV